MLDPMTETSAYDVAAVRAHFPSLAPGVGTGAAHFDGPGGSQTPDVVAQAMYDVLIAPLANRGAVTPAERNADAAVLDCRLALADLLGGEPDEVVVGRSMTQLTMDLARTLAAQWGPGDEVVVSRLDHDANVRPWIIAAEAVGARVRWAEIDLETTELTVGAVTDAVTDRTRLVAVTGAANLLGTRPDLPGIAAVAHAAGALLFVDGVHLTAHAAVDVTTIGADFYACSPYKFLGPHCGAVWGRTEVLAELRPDKLLPSSDRVPERFELGTLPYELMAGTTAAVDFLAALGELGEAGGGPATHAGASRRDRLLASMAIVEEHEDRLRTRVEAGLGELPGVTLWSRAEHRTPTLLVTFAGRDPQAVRAGLAERGVNAPAGTFYAVEPARALGLGDVGGIRIGLAPYTDDHDVDRLLESLTQVLTGC